MAKQKRTIRKELENILDEPVIKEPEKITASVPKIVNTPSIRDQYKDLKYLLNFYNYKMSEDGSTYTKNFIDKKYTNTVTFLENGKIQVDCSASGRKIIDISDAFNWIY